ncbi:amidase domain-containing protein [Halobacillus sp. Marseille-Q1614]|uniref:amidase domain-containing protein n=1 Tax=Halobacillus sp. Marseille-Q1614 TaxID=2709134 RepID=UPI00156D9DD0|nr:amidase domain-containing protein [Halobacillus sp. Marseille-Q1614]
MDIIKSYWNEILNNLPEQQEEQWLARKIEGMRERGSRVSQATFHIIPYHRVTYEAVDERSYLLAIRLYVKDGARSYVEEGIYSCRGRIEHNQLIENMTITEKNISDRSIEALPFFEEAGNEVSRFNYDRREAVRYAEQWWDSYNPAYMNFENNCTNYISQCLRAGGAPVWGHPHRGKGWWYGGKTWSYSWTVANAMRWYLSGARKGLVAIEVQSADELSPGDVICYDFEGDGRYDHTTIVVSKDSEGEPLVNAHTTNSRQRYWKYEDSTAYTPNIKYKFFKIGG